MAEKVEQDGEGFFEKFVVKLFIDLVVQMFLHI